jgi:hypothetical protein
MARIAQRLQRLQRLSSKPHVATMMHGQVLTTLTPPALVPVTLEDLQAKTAPMRRIQVVPVALEASLTCGSFERLCRLLSEEPALVYDSKRLACLQTLDSHGTGLAAGSVLRPDVRLFFLLVEFRQTLTTLATSFGSWHGTIPGVRGQGRARARCHSAEKTQNWATIPRAPFPPLRGVGFGLSAFLATPRSSPRSRATGSWVTGRLRGLRSQARLRRGSPCGCGPSGLGDRRVSRERGLEHAGSLMSWGFHAGETSNRGEVLQPQLCAAIVGAWV